MQAYIKRHWVALIPVFIGIAFSLTAILYAGSEKAEFGDARDYINAAHSFLNGIPYPRISFSQPMFRPPLFPLWMAAIWSVFPNSIFAVKIAQVLLHGGTVFVAYRIVYEILRKKTPALMGAFICAINPLLVAYTLDIYTEPLYTFLCALGMLLVVKLLKSDSRWFLHALGAGVIFGLAVLCRPAVLGIALPIGVIFPLFYLKSGNFLKYSAAAVIFIGSIFLTLAPWTYQNYRDTGEFILVNDGFSYNLWVGNRPEALRIYEDDFSSVEERNAYADSFWGGVQAKIAEFETTDNYSSLTLNEKEKVWKKAAIKDITQDYGLTASLVFEKFRVFWTPFLDKFLYSPKVGMLVAIFVIGTYIFGAYGAYVFSQSPGGGKFVILLLITFLVTTMLHVMIIALLRYRVPNVDPYLSMLAGVAVWNIATKIFPGNFLNASVITPSK